VTFTTVGVVGAAGLSEPHAPATTAIITRAIHEISNRILNVLSSGRK
jgi:hypothetical protein